MGSYYVDAVLNGLKGRAFSQRVGGTDAKPKIKNFNVTELAFLLTIAARQPNPGSMNGDLDPISFGDPATLQSLMHISNTAFHESKNFLQKLGLITFSKEERHPDPRDPSRMRRFTNVYRINLETIRGYFPDVMSWRREVLKIADDAKISEDVLRTLKAYEGRCVRKTESPLRETDSPLRLADKKVRKTDSNTIRETSSESHSTTPTHCFTQMVCRMIAAKLGTSENRVNEKFVGKVVAEKYSESVLAVLANLGNDKQTRWVFEANDPVRAIVSILRKLPRMEDDSKWREKFAPSAEQVIKQIASEDIRFLTSDAVRKTGYHEGNAFAKKVAGYLTRLFQTPEGREYAVETIGNARRTEGSSPEIAAEILLGQLRQGLRE